MSAVIETATEAACRLFGHALRDGYQQSALHEYRDAEGLVAFFRVRLMQPGKPKIVRPFHHDGARFVMGEPPAPATGKLLYLLPDLLAADPATVVFVVEGENCVDALATLGVLATTSGSASSADAADWSPLRGRRVRLWPDNDEPGAQYADNVEVRLRALGCDVQRIDVGALNLSAKDDAVNWIAANVGATAADVMALTLVDPSCESEAQGDEVAHARSAPEPLRRPVPPSEPYPVDELGDVLAPAVESLRRVIQAPDAVSGASVLAAASLAAQALADVEIDGRVVPLSLWMLTVAESGERKSAVDAEAMRAARAHEHEQAADYVAEFEKHADTMAEWEGRREDAKKKAKKSGGIGLADALKEIGPAPLAPLVPRLLVADFTAEGLAKLLALSLPSVGAFTDEAALVFGGHGMTTETVMRTAGTLCKLWDSGTLDRVRAMDGAMKLHGRRMALHLMAQPVIAERALSDDVLAGQGFLARCLLAWPASTAGTRAYCMESLRSDEAMERMVFRLGELHRQKVQMAEGTRQQLDPRALTLDAEAKNVWISLHDSVEVAMRPDGDYANVKAWASKTPEQALRIAGVLMLLADGAAETIDAATMERACELALWHLNEAVRLAGTSAAPPQIRDAEALLAWCHETGRALLCSWEALRLGPNRIREREAFHRAVAELERAGWATPVEDGAVIGGKHRKQAWRIAPEREGG